MTAKKLSNKAQKDYIAILKTGGEEYKSKSGTIYEVFSNFPVTFDKIKTKGTVEVSQGKKRYERFLLMRQIRMCLISKGFRNHLARQFGHFLNADGKRHL